MQEAERRAQVSPEAVSLALAVRTYRASTAAACTNSAASGRSKSTTCAMRWNSARRCAWKMTGWCLQVCPQDFTLDGRAGYRNPRGIMCARLEANVHVVTASAQEHQALMAAVHRGAPGSGGIRSSRLSPAPMPPCCRKIARAASALWISARNPLISRSMMAMR